MVLWVRTRSSAGYLEQITLMEWQNLMLQFEVIEEFVFLTINK